MVAFTTGGYSPGRNFQFGRSGAIYVRRYANPWQWLTYLAFSAAAFPVAWLRELRRGNQAAAVAKLKGMWAGLKAEIPPPPSLDKDYLPEAGTASTGGLKTKPSRSAGGLGS
jgi:hypothetical protein